MAPKLLRDASNPVNWLQRTETGSCLRSTWIRNLHVYSINVLYQVTGFDSRYLLLAVLRPLAHGLPRDMYLSPWQQIINRLCAKNNIRECHKQVWSSWKSHWLHNRSTRRVKTVELVTQSTTSTVLQACYFTPILKPEGWFKTIALSKLNIQQFVAYFGLAMRACQ